jgi:hypothetical protein
MKNSKNFKFLPFLPSFTRGGGGHQVQLKSAPKSKKFFEVFSLKSAPKSKIGSFMKVFFEYCNKKGA